MQKADADRVGAGLFEQGLQLAELRVLGAARPLKRHHLGGHQLGAGHAQQFTHPLEHLLLQGVIRLGGTTRLKPQLTIPAITPRWSPDGRWIAYAANSDGDWDIYLFNPESGVTINLTQDLPGDQFEPAWSKH